MRRRLLSLMLTVVMLLGTGVGAAFAAEPRTVDVGNAAELIAAIADLQPGDTIVMAAGTYDVGRSFPSIVLGGQGDWYLPLWQEGVTLRGAGAGETVLTSSVYSANGSWPSQDFISVWANGVTIEGVTIQSKRDTNKAIEVMGKDFTLRDVDVMTNPAGPWQGYDYYKFSGSVYFNPQLSVTGTAGDVGASVLENVSIDGAWVSAPTSGVTTGTISLQGVTLDWTEAAYAPYASYGMMSPNVVFQVVADVFFIVDDTMGDLAFQATGRMPAGATLIYHGSTDPDTTIPGAVFTALKDGGTTYPADGMMEFAFESTTTPGFVPYAWTFPIGSLDVDFDAPFYPHIGVRTTVDTPVGNMQAAVELPDNGLHAAELDFAHGGALPGPASVRVFLDEALAGLTFDLMQYAGGSVTAAALGEPVERVTADAEGFVTIGIDTGDLWYLLQYLEHTVTFLDWDGRVLSQQAVEHGQAAVAPADPTREGYTFTGWDADFSNVTEDLTINATYEQDVIEFVRHGGDDRIETAIETALGDFPGGADVAVLAYARNFPDALAASTLAGVADAPILLTGTDVLDWRTAEALEALGVAHVYIVGGPRVVSAEIEEGLDADYSVVRLGGADRYETARLIAEEAVELGAVRDKAFLAYGGSFADALSVSSIAAQRGIPVLLTQTGSLDAHAAAFLRAFGVDDVYVAGGPAVVSDDLLEDIEGAGRRVVRWGGLDRYETAAAVANGARDAFGLTFAVLGVASGADFPDALAGGAALGKQDGLLTISNPLSLSAPTAGVVEANRDDIVRVEFFGGTAALSDDVEQAVRQLLAR